VPKQLLPGETRVGDPIRRHWIVLARQLVIPGLAAVVAIALLDGVATGATESNPTFTTVQVIATLAILASLSVWAWWVWLNWTASALTLTDQRVILEEGVLFRTTQAIPLDRVQDVSTRQGLLGRLLDYGSVEVDTAGAIANEVFTYVPRPETLRDDIFVGSTELRRS
jgi:uncharacterized membrane protein YdbT with pleckstrin-like domain